MNKADQDQLLSNSIGDTPLVPLSWPNMRDPVWAKLEYLNLTGSLKDRSAIFLLDGAEKSGELLPASVIVDASSGNFGISLGVIGKLKGHQVHICVDRKISVEKLATLKALGVAIEVCNNARVLTDEDSYHTSAIQLRDKLNSNGYKVYMPNQFFNPKAADAYFETLGPELWRQSNGQLTHVFCAVGTGATVTGTGRYLKSKNPAIKVIAVDSNNSYYSTKGKPRPYEAAGFGIDYDSPILKNDVIDEFISVSDEEAFTGMKAMSKYGLLVGCSCGAIASAIRAYFDVTVPRNAFPVMVFGDSGRSYLSCVQPQNHQAN